MATYKKRPSVIADQQKERDAQARPSQATPSARPANTERSMQILKSAAHKYVAPESNYVSSLTPEKDYQAAAKVSAVENFNKNTGIGNALGAPSLRDVTRAMPESFATRNAQQAESIENTNPQGVGGAAYGGDLATPGYKYVDGKKLAQQPVNAGGAFGANLYSSLGASNEGIAGAIFDALGKLGMKEYADIGHEVLSAIGQTAQKGREEHPIASTAGSIAGNVTLMQAIGAPLNGIQAAPLAKGVLGGAATIGGTSALQNIGNLTSGKQTVGEYAGNAALSAAGGAIGAGISYGIGQAGVKLAKALGSKSTTHATNYILNNPAYNVALGGTKAAGFAAGSTGTRELYRAATEDNYEPDWKQIGESAATSFAFGALSETVNVLRMNAQNKAIMAAETERLKQGYSALDSAIKSMQNDPGRSPAEVQEAARKVMNLSANMYEYYNNVHIVGAQKEIEAALEFLAEVNHVAEQYAYADVGAAAATPTAAQGLLPGAAGASSPEPQSPVSPVAPGPGEIQPATPKLDVSQPTTAVDGIAAAEIAQAAEIIANAQKDQTPAVTAQEITDGAANASDEANRQAVTQAIKNELAAQGVPVPEAEAIAEATAAVVAPQPAEELVSAAPAEQEAPMTDLPAAEQEPAQPVSEPQQTAKEEEDRARVMEMLSDGIEVGFLVNHRERRYDIISVDPEKSEVTLRDQETGEQKTVDALSLSGRITHVIWNEAGKEKQHRRYYENNVTRDAHAEISGPFAGLNYTGVSNGYMFCARRIDGGQKWEAVIARVHGHREWNNPDAHEIIYTSGAFDTKGEAMDNLLDVAWENKLLEKENANDFNAPWQAEPEPTAEPESAAEPEAQSMPGAEDMIKDYASTLGEAGAKAFIEYYKPGQNVADYTEEATRIYNQGRSGDVDFYNLAQNGFKVLDRNGAELIFYAGVIDAENEATRARVIETLSGANSVTINDQDGTVKYKIVSIDPDTGKIVLSNIKTGKQKETDALLLQNKILLVHRDEDVSKNTGKATTSEAAPASEAQTGYDRVRASLEASGKAAGDEVTVGGYTFRVFRMNEIAAGIAKPGAAYAQKWMGQISRHSDGNVTNARDTIYTSKMLGSKEEAINDILTVAEANKLLDEQAAPEPAPVKQEKPAEKEAPKKQEKPAEKAPAEGKPAPKQADDVTPQLKLAQSVLEVLKSDKSLTWQELFKLADKAYGGTQAEGAYNVKNAYDGMELAINMFLNANQIVKELGNGSLADAQSVLTYLENFMVTIPRESKRTDEQITFQQFSTPPTIAYIASWVSNFNENDVVLEPSAGIGGLAVFPHTWGATVYGNELSDQRIAFLKELGLKEVFHENAEQIDNVLPDYVKPTSVIMNPPFSSTAGRTSKNKTTNSQRHLTQALERLEPNGRLVAILGEGASEDAANFKKFWADIKKEYNVRANIGIAGDNYNKYGTTWGIQLVVIDKNGPTTGETLTEHYDKLSDALTALEGIRNDRPEITTVSGRDTRTIGDSGQLEQRPDGGNDRVGAPEVSADVRRREKQGSKDGVVSPDGRKMSDVDEGVRGVRGKSEGNTAVSESPRSGENRPGVGRSDDRVRVISDGSSGTDQRDGDVRSAIRAKEAEENVDNVYAQYVPSKVRIEGAIPHPAKLVESAAMASVELPDPTYTPALPASIAKNGVLSDAQLETVVYAGQAHEQVLPDGKRKGFFLGDGTGVGKGRQIAGIIMDNFLQGRKKAVWISEKKNLINDAKRDWADLGGKADDIINMADGKFVKKGFRSDEGIAFCAYTSLVSKNAPARMDLLQKWLGKDFDGVIVFDEAHNMGNSVKMKGKRGTTKPAQKALQGIALQEAFPNARIVYASATGASSIEQYGYLTRLGLWGKGTAFNDLNDFISKLSQGGIAAMELLARDMKAMGAYLSRSISYDGVQYDSLEHALTPQQRDIYRATSEAWQKVLQNVNKALEATGAAQNGRAKSDAYSALFGAQQRFYNTLLTAMSVPTVIADIRKELDKGNSVVIQLTSTNEAQTERALEKNAEEGGDLDELDLSPSDMLQDLLMKSFPINEYTEVEDERGNIHSELVLDANGDPVISKKAVAMRDALIAELGMMKLPDGALDQILQAFGPEMVAENTGRSKRVIEQKGDDGRIHRIVESRNENKREADVNAFQDGKKRIMVFSEAGGTGKSYHADRRAKNQQHRVHYLLQAGWQANKAVQGFGRTHRSNEASAPTYRLVSTDVLGQKRFTSTIARRLDQLGALTKGQRQAGSGIFGEKDNLENPLASEALFNYYKSDADRDVMRKIGLYDKVYDEWGRVKDGTDAPRNVPMFLNRILSLDVDEQNEVFTGFYDKFQQYVDQAIANGTLDMGLENYRADKVEVIDEKTVRENKNGGDTKYLQLEASKKANITQFGDLKTAHDNFKGLYRLENGDVRAVYQIASKTDPRTGEVVTRYRLDSPTRGKSSNYKESTLKEKATPIDKADWGKAWNEEIKKQPQYTTEKLHMLTGTLLPIWDKLPQSNTRVMRVTTSDGKTYLGRIISPNDIDTVLSGLGQKRTMPKISGAEAVNKVLKDGDVIMFRDSRMRAERVRVSGENRIELKGDNVYWIQRSGYPGVFNETINYRTRFFVRTGDAGAAFFDAYTKDNPIVDVISGKNNEDEDLYRAGQEPSENWRAESGRLNEMSSTTINEIAKSVISSNGAEGLKATTVAAQLRKLYDLMGKTDPADAAYAEVETMARNIAEQIVDAAREEMPSLTWTPETRKDVKSFFRGARLTAPKQYLTEAARALGYETYNDLRKALTGKTTLVASESDASAGASGVDSVYYELNSMYPAIFPDAGNISLPEMVENIATALSEAYADPEKVNPYDVHGGREEAVIDIAWDLIQKFYDPKYNHASREESYDSRWSTARIGDKDKKPMSISDIIKKAQHDFGINVTKGHIRGRGVLGRYNRKNNGIRIKIANDLPTFAHELGHALDNKYLFREGLSDAAKRELIDNLSKQVKAAYKKDRWITEGIAEFLRKYLQNSEQARKEYPVFSEFFLKGLSPEDLTLVTNFADEINAYYSLGTAQTSIRRRSDGQPDYRTFREKASDVADRLYQDWIDATHSIKTLIGDKAHKLAIISSYSDAVAGRILESDVLTDINGQYVGPGFKTVFAGFDMQDKKVFADLSEYLVMRHGLEYLKEGMDVFADPKFNNEDYMLKRIDELQQEYGPKIIEFAERFYTFIDNFNRAWGVGTGRINAEEYEQWRERWPDYVPFNRAIEKGSVGVPGKKSFANQGKAYKRAKGGTQELYSPIDNLVYNIVSMVTNGTNNVVMQAVTNAAEEGGIDAAIMEKIPPEMVPKMLDAAGIKEKLSDAFGEAVGGDMETMVAIDRLLNIIPDTVVQFEQGKPFGNIVTVMKDGKRSWWKINDPDLLESLVNINPPKLGAFMEAYGATTRFLTANITGNNPVWSVFSNAPRDLGTFMVYFKGNRIKALGALASTYANAFRYKWKDGKGVDPYYNEYLALGGGQTSVYAADVDLAKRAINKLSSTKAQKALSAANPLNWVMFISNTIEQGPRYATYSMMRQAGLDPHEAFYEAMDVTVNFRRGGVKSRQLNKIFPFFNAQFQGTDKMARFFAAEDVPKERRAKARLARWSTFFTASATIAMLMFALNHKDDDDEKNYDGLSTYVKNNFFCFPNGDGTFFTIPKPRELAVVESFFETVFEATLDKNNHAFDEFYDYATDNFMPGVLSNVAQLPTNIARDGAQEGILNDTLGGAVGSAGLFGVFASMWANRDFLGRPIDSAMAYKQYQEPRDSYNDSTSKMAYSIGQAFNLSPQMIDYFGNNVFGYWWKFPKAVFPVGGDPDLTLGVKSTYKKDSLYSTDIVNWMYDYRDQTARAKGSDGTDPEKVFDAAMADRMAKFYSTFNRLNRAGTDAASKRNAREIALEMIYDYRQSVEAGTYPDAMKAVYKAMENVDDTTILPSVMREYVKDGDDVKIYLSDREYLDFVTDYNARYYGYAESRIKDGQTAAEQKAILSAAKKVALEGATNKILERLGAPATEYAEKYSGVSDEHVLEFLAQKDLVNDDGLKQAEVIAIIETMLAQGLKYDEAYALFHSVYEKDKNNPWAPYK